MKVKICCCLVVVSFLLLYSKPVCSFTLIYKSGKRIEGTWLSEDQHTIQVKNQEGVVLTVQKTQLDLQAMSVASRYAVRSQNPQPALRSASTVASNLPETQHTSQTERTEIAKNNGTIQDTIASPPHTNVPPEMTGPASERTKPQEKWSVFTNFYNGYDSNIDHDLDAVRSVGVVYGGGVKYRNRSKDPSFWISYEIANHHYTNTDKWDRVSQTILTTYSIALSRKWLLQNLGEISFKGSSEDRELSDNFVFRPMLVYRLTDSDQLGVFVAQRFKRFDDVDNSRNANNRFVGLTYEREFGKHELEFVYKYEKNNANADRGDYVRSTYSVEYKMPLFRKNIAAFEFKARPTRFFHRFAEIDVDGGPDIEIPRRDIKWNFTVELAIPIGNNLELVPTYEFEKRTSNDEEEFYTAHLPAVTLHYVW
jgi:hypothetical protein